ncbi:uncharacterized protein [Chelonus insularis]|uniref:uncharacterized protein n=1 Tax=Chelonus insularis TaxID=460826 RepID=UPI00158C8F1E|nr:uncharacterized protein LOC118072672 [Chelonus insularis]
MFLRNQKSSKNNHTSSTSNVDPIPQSLKEVIGLMDSINKNLEDCAMEWQSKVSKQQWKMLNTEFGGEKSRDLSLLSRTYFADETLDDAFHKLLAYVRTFMEYLNSFTALLQGERSISIPGDKKDVGIQNSDHLLSDANEISKEPVVAPLDLSILDKSSNLSETRRRSKRLAEISASNVQQCFADLIKAKIELDTKFLGFEAVLNGDSDNLSPPTEEVYCLCQICSNVLGTVIENQKVLNDAMSKPKMRRTTTPSPKKLGRSSARLWKKNERRKQSVSLVNMTDESMISPKNMKNV